MFSWYRTQIADHGFFAATLLLLRVVWRRLVVVVSNQLLPARLECPCCGWKGRRFFDYIEIGYTVPNAACPQCDSHSRHRALFLWLRDKYHLREKTGVALLFAPEKSLAPLWQTAPDLQTVKVDIEAARGVDVRGDLMQLPIASDTADLIWCHHVLEQTPDHRVALNELYRVLRPSSGELIVSVGAGDQETTVEFGFSNKALSGNHRRFGKDFSERLAEAGFQVRPMTYELSAEELRKYAIYQEQFYRCLKNQGEALR
jgi:SAM-dependent methyltransferase